MLAWPRVVVLAFMPGCAAHTLRLTIQIPDIATWREIKVPVDITFEDLSWIV